MGMMREDQYFAILRQIVEHIDDVLVAPRSFAGPSIRRSDISETVLPAMRRASAMLSKRPASGQSVRDGRFKLNEIALRHHRGSSGTGTVSQRIAGRSLKTSSFLTRIMNGAIRGLSLSRFLEPSMTRIMREPPKVLWLTWQKVPHTRNAVILKLG